MDLKKVRKEILLSISEKLKVYGFTFNTKKVRFECEIKGNLQIFDLLFFPSKEGTFVEPVFRLKNYIIEDIYHQVTQKDSEYNDSTETLGNSLGQIIKYFEQGDQIGTTENIMYLIENEDDIEILVKIIPKRFEQYILRYFNENSSIGRVNLLLNSNPRDLSIHNRIYPNRACIGVIAAKLTNNKDLKQLIQIYREELSEANPVSKQEFETLVKILMESKELNQ